MVRSIYVWLRLQVALQGDQWFKKKLCVKKYGKRRACVVSKGDGCPWGWVVQREGLDAGSRVRRDEGPLTSAAALKTQEGGVSFRGCCSFPKTNRVLVFLCRGVERAQISNPSSGFKP